MGESVPGRGLGAYKAPEGDKLGGVRRFGVREAWPKLWILRLCSAAL